MPRRQASALESEADPGPNFVLQVDEGRDRILSPEKEELVNSVILLQETLVDISTKVKVVEQQNAESQKEIDVLQLYVDNMMAKISAVKNVSTEL